ncbi:hypothetical protein ANRL1_02405 [Anaerolineae bacterium]|nr:hypothetical protein ANRL1_02405 [Anaerolineae bacterium]
MAILSARTRILCRSFRAVTLALTLICATVYAAGASSPAPPSEYHVKAAFIFNFAKFVEWPESSFGRRDAPLVVGILGRDPFGDALDSIRGKNVQGRSIVVRRIEKGEDLAGCHILFVCASERRGAASVVKDLRNAPVLLVSDIKGFTRLGGTIGLRTVRNRIQFEINPDAAQRAGLRMSAQLLRLATIVRDQDGGND